MVINVIIVKPALFVLFVFVLLLVGWWSHCFLIFYVFIYSLFSFKLKKYLTLFPTY